MLDNEKWTLSTDTYRSLRDSRFKRIAAHIASRLASKSKFLGKSWSRCARRSPRISPGITSRQRVDSHRAFQRRFTDGQGNFFAVAAAAIATTWVCHREKCWLFFSDCDKRASPQGYTWVNAGTRVDVSISWLTNDRRPSSCTVTPQHAATVGQPVDKLMSKANWRDAARAERTSRVAEAEAHPGFLDDLRSNLFSKLARVVFYHREEKRNATVFPSTFLDF